LCENSSDSDAQKIKANIVKVQNNNQVYYSEYHHKTLVETELDRQPPSGEEGKVFKHYYDDILLSDTDLLIVKVCVKENEYWSYGASATAHFLIRDKTASCPDSYVEYAQPSNLSGSCQTE
jgi:hypothetical protein